MTEKILFIILTFSIIIMAATLSYAEDADHIIIHPTENADGTPLTDLAGIIVKCGDNDWHDLGMATRWKGPVDCAFKAYDTSGNQSEPWSIKVGVQPYPPIVLIYQGGNQ